MVKGKYSFIKTENIVPIQKTYEWKYLEGYNGKEKTITFNVYPYKVEEKLEIQNLTKKAQDLSNTGDDTKQEEAMTLFNEILDRSAYFIMRKDDSEVTLEEASAVPNNVKNELVYLALEHEGITREQLEQASKKEIDIFKKLKD